MKKKVMKKSNYKKFKSNPKNFLIGAIIVVIILIAGAVWYFGIEKHTFQDFIALVTTKNDGTTNNGGKKEISDFENLSNVRLSVHFIDVGQGDCILILFPDGKEMLIDCANYNNSTEYKDSALNYLSEYIKDGQIDYLMLTHCDSDHVYFLDDVLSAYDVDNIYMPNVLAAPSSLEKAAQVAALDSAKLARFTDPNKVDSGCYADFFVAALSEEGASIYLNIGEFKIEGADYSIVFYGYTEEEWTENKLKNAEEKNAISPIGILEYCGLKVVLTGDSNLLNEPSFIRKAGGEKLDCDVLKVGHHGSETSSTDAFLDYIDCEYAVISCNAKGNNFEHPRAATLERLTSREMTVYRTDLNGTVVFAVDNTGKFAFSLQKEAK